MKVRTRLLAMMLAIVMIVSILPVGALAGNAYGHYKHKDLPSEGASAQTQTLIIAASDFQDPDTESSGSGWWGGSSDSYSYDAQQTRIRTIVGKIKAAYSDYTGTYGFFAGGDYEFEETNSTTKVNAGISAVQSAVTDVLGSSVDSVFVQGNHDPKVNAFLSTGGHDTANYGVFVINEDDYESKPSSDTKTKATANLLKTYLAGKVNESYAKPIFVLSHVPLHYSTRTKANGDAQYAKYIYDAIYAYGDKLNIIFLYGHDHAWGDDDYLGDSAVYLTPNDKINIATSKDAYEAKPLNFTYMNYGYVGYCWESYNTHEAGHADNTLTMTSFLIDAGTVTIRRWDVNGEHVLKAAGVSCSGSRGVAEVCTPDTTVYTSPQTLVLKSFAPIGDDDTDTDTDTDIDTEIDEEPVELTDNDFPGITVNACGSSVEIKTADTTATYANIAKYVAYDISVADFVKGTTATVSLPLPTGFDAGKIQAYYRDADGKLEAMPTSVGNGVVTFTTNHFSEYMVAELEAGEWQEINIEGTITTVHKYVLDTDGLDSGSDYLIVAPSGTDIALVANNNNSSADRRNVTINNNQIVMENANSDWHLANGKLTDNRGYYLRRRYNNSTDTNLSINNTDAHNVWTIVDQDKPNGVYRISNEGYFVRYNDGYALSNSTDQKYIPMRNLRWFKYSPETNTVGGEHYWVSMSGDTAYTFSTTRFTSSTELENYLREQIKVYRKDSANATTAYDVAYTLTGSADPKTAGTYNYTVAYDGHTVGTVKVTIEAKTISSIAWNEAEGYVYRGAKAIATTGAKLTVNYNDNTHDTVDITLGMLNNDASVVGDYPGLTVSYGGKSISGFTLHVLTNPNENDYPEYPDGGSVRVNKTGNSIDWYDTGIAKIELSATGIPVEKGIDVILMLDTSSSMIKNLTPDNKTRLAVMKESLTELRNILTARREDGTVPDIRVAMADFNGYNNINSQDTLDKSQTQTNYGKVFTGSGAINAAAFVPAADITDSIINGITTHSGTNYDYAFDTIYRLGSAIKAKNAAEDTERDLVVIFMSDGAAFQYNYYITDSNYANEKADDPQPVTDTWNGWLTGQFTGNTAYSNSVHKYFYNPGFAVDGTTPVQKHWMAEAIKGAEDATYKVISPNSTLPNSVAITNQDYMYNVPGLGATMYTIGYSLADDKGGNNSETNPQINTSVDQAKQGALKSTMEHNIKYLASVGEGGDYLYYPADTAAQLNNVFDNIANQIRKAATNARFVDTMGADYDLQLKTVNYANNTKTITPTIEVREYDVYKNSDIGKTIDGVQVTKEMVGQRRGEGTLLEKVRFNAEGTAAYIDGVAGGSSILSDGVICAKTFWYNTNATTTVKIDADGDGVDEYDLAPETFYWKIGTIGESEFVLSYYVYLTESMEGHREPGNYATNESAVLYYTNWLDHDAEKSVKSPSFPWKDAIVSYGFYLVDEKGNVLVNRTTGATGSFANMIEVVGETKYDSIYLNNGTTIDTADLTIPDGYSLYNGGATYQISIASGTSTNEGWTITNNALTQQQIADGYVSKYTYVTDYNGNAYSNDTSVNEQSYDYTHTVVWFALVFEIKCVPDVVVIDYGLPVDIDVLANDIFGNSGSLSAIGYALPQVNPEGATELVDIHYTAEIDTARYLKSLPELVYGSAELKNGKVRYTPKNMQMDSIDVFAYAALYNNERAPQGNGYYYDTVTVVPATIIYYEDDFVTFTGDWGTAGTTDGGTQAQDRPGTSTIAATLDANNVYGFDQAYQSCSTYSNGSARVATVNSMEGPTAEFTFTGTAFDLISLTSNSTGTIVVNVTDTKDSSNKYKWIVDTYYGYTCELDEENPYVKCTWWTEDKESWHVKREPTSETSESGTVPNIANAVIGEEYVTYEENWVWTAKANDPNALYQIPVIKSPELKYSTYNVVVMPTYDKFFDHTNAGSYDFYFDAVRIYNPAKNDDYSNEVYVKDNEAYPQFIEVRKNLLAQGAFEDDGTTLSNAAVFIDGFGVNGDISEYKQYGPNNEIYLAKGQAVAFKLDAKDAENIASVQISAKSVNGSTSLGVMCGDADGSISLATSTDLYYDITGLIDWNGNTSETIILANNTANIVSITNVKITYKTEPIANTLMTMSRSAAQTAVKSVFAAYVAANTAEPEEPFVVEPEVFEPAKVSVKVTGKNFKVGDTISATITTSSDVASLTLNGIAAKLKKTDKKTGEKTWTVSVKASAVGDMILSVIAYDSEGVASDPIQSTITVKAKNGNGKKAKP